MSTYTYNITGGSTSGGTITTGGTHTLYNRLMYELLNGSTSGGNLLYGRGLQLTGGSTSGGFIHYGRAFHTLTGGSTSGGRIDTRRLYLILGGSTSGGNINTNRKYIAVGGSYTGGLIDTLRKYVEVLTGYSTSGGIIATNRHYIITGTSNSGGTIDHALIQTVLAWLGCYVLNLDTKRTYQFDNYQFRGIGRFNDKLIGINATGVQDLETTATHDGTSTDIAAYFELGNLDFGIPDIKGIRNTYIEGTGGTVVTVTFTKSDSTTVIVSMTLNQFTSLPKTLLDKYIAIKVANTSGEQVTITKMEGNLNIIKRKGD